jgi:hypothetical protein
MYAYVHQKNITVLSSYDPAHPDWVRDNAFFRKQPDDVCKKTERFTKTGSGQT